MEYGIMLQNGVSLLWLLEPEINFERYNVDKEDLLDLYNTWQIKHTNAKSKSKKKIITKITKKNFHQQKIRK